MNLIQVKKKILCIALTLEVPFCLLKYGTRKYYIAILTNISVRRYRTMYFEVSATSSATCWFAARRSTEANERGSWQLHTYGLRRLVDSRPTEHHGDPVSDYRGSQSLQLCCRNAKTVQILSCGYKQTFLLILRWLSCIVFCTKGFHDRF